GQGPSLLVIPHENASFEAYRPLNDDPTPRSITFEGFHEWLIHSKSFVQTEWRGVEQWNEATSSVLQPGEVKSYALKFVLAPSIREIENELIVQGIPVAIGAPGYLLPLDNPAKLFLKYKRKVRDISVYPEGSLHLDTNATTANQWSSYTVTGLQWGRSRVQITYDDGNIQTVHYKVIKPEKQVVADLGNFLTN